MHLNNNIQKFNNNISVNTEKGCDIRYRSLSSDLHDILLKNSPDNDRSNYNHNCSAFVHVLSIFSIPKTLHFTSISRGVNCK